MCQHFPRRWYAGPTHSMLLYSYLLTFCHISCLPMLSCLSLLYMCDLGLCPFSGLVCDLLLRGVRGLSPKCALPEEYLDHNCQKSFSHCQQSISMANPQKSDNSNLHGLELHRPSSKGTKLLFQVIQAIINQWERLWIYHSLCQGIFQDTLCGHSILIDPFAKPHLYQAPLRVSMRIDYLHSM